LLTLLLQLKCATQRKLNGFTKAGNQRKIFFINTM
jgi:hypothetical protein